MKRICLFAGWDSAGIVEDYVKDYIKEISKYADVYYLADCEMKSSELNKINHYTQKALAFRHGKYDFGSWSELTNIIGWEEINKYDEIILANDSQYLVGDFASFFLEMEGKGFEFWSGLAVDEDYINGMTSLTNYVGDNEVFENKFTFVSSFMVFIKDLFCSETIRTFFSNIESQENRLNVSLIYEIGLTRTLLRRHVKYGLFINQIFSWSAIYSDTAFYLLSLGYPFIKSKVFNQPYYEVNYPINRLKVYLNNSGNFLGDAIFRHIERKNKDISNEKSIYSRVFEKILSKYKITGNGRLKKVLKLAIKILFGILKRLLGILRRLRYAISESSYSDGMNWFQFLYKFGLTRFKQKNIKLNNKNKMIIYFNVARDSIGGGMLSINRFVEKSKTLINLSDYEIIMSGLPLNNPPIEYTKFQASSPLIHFNNIVLATSPEEVIIHIPEVFLENFCNELNDKQVKWLLTIPKLQFNIMNQNNNLMPERDIVRINLSKFSENITMTTAHKRYCTQYLSNKYDVPVHQLTPFIPEFHRIEFEKKKKVILVSSDEYINNSRGISKKAILERLQSELPDFEIIIIQNMFWEEYKKYISESMFSISFGEGFDGYFVEPYLSKSLSFAVFNSIFFPSEFINCETIYESWEDLYKNIVSDMKKYSSNQKLYEQTQMNGTEMIRKYISDEVSLQQLFEYYSGNYDFYPSQQEYQLFNNIKKTLEEDHGFRFFGGDLGDEYVITPDQNILINMRGEFYSVLYEVYVKKDYDFEINDNFILLDVGFHAGITSLNFIRSHPTLKAVYGFEPMYPNYNIGQMNIKNNISLDVHIDLKLLGLSDKFSTQDCLYIPDWSTGMSTENTYFINDMLTSTEMPEKIQMIQAEVVPAHVEIGPILEENKNYKVVLKCDAQGAEFSIIKNLDEHKLLSRIDIIILETHKDDPIEIVNSLIANGFKVKDELDYEPNNIHMIYAYKVIENVR